MRGSGKSKEERGRLEVDAAEEKEDVENAEKLRARREVGFERREVWTSLESIMLTGCCLMYNADSGGGLLDLDLCLYGTYRIVLGLELGGNFLVP